MLFTDVYSCLVNNAGYVAKLIGLVCVVKSSSLTKLTKIFVFEMSSVSITVLLSVCSRINHSL